MAERRWCLWLGDASARTFAQCRKSRRRVDGVREHPQEEQTADNPRTGGEPNAFRRNPPAGRPLSFDPLGLIRDPPVHPDGVHAENRYRQQPCSLHSPRNRLSFRRSVVGDAHGLGAASERAAGDGLPVLQSARLQQLPLAARAKRKTACGGRGGGKDRPGRPRRIT